MKIIEVIPNPYIALDKDGVPQGVVGAGLPGLFIGALQDLVASQDTGKNRFYYPLGEKKSMRKRVVLTPEISTAINAGELIVCEEADAKACGFVLGPNSSFLDPDAALAAEKAKALAYWQDLKGDENGPDKSASIGEIPRTPTERGATSPVPVTSKQAQLTPSVKLAKNTEA
jgi:hypothetical protein